MYLYKKAESKYVISSEIKDDPLLSIEVDSLEMASQLAGKYLFEKGVEDSYTIDFEVEIDG